MEKLHVNYVVINDYENSEHFLLHCTALQETRQNVIGLR